jgi:large subunit ribosomal protein L16
MLLQPRKFKYKTRQKQRSARIAGISHLRYGTMGLRLLKPFRVSAKKIFRLKLFLKRSSRKADITKRAFWVSIFPHLPLSRKPKGMRMGKGAGKLSTWYTQIRGGRILVEFKNLRLGRARYYSNQVAHKLPVPATFTCLPTRVLKVVGARKTNPSLLSFW